MSICYVDLDVNAIGCHRREWLQTDGELVQSQRKQCYERYYFTFKKIKYLYATYNKFDEKNVSPVIIIIILFIFYFFIPSVPMIPRGV